MERFLVNVEEHRQIPPSLYGSRTTGSLGRALFVALRTMQARGDDAASIEGQPGRPVYRLDEYEARKRSLKTSLEHWGICVVTPMLNEEGDQVDALGLAGLDGGTDFIIALRLLSERYNCNRLETIERYFPAIYTHWLNDRAITVAVSLKDFKVMTQANGHDFRTYGPLYDGLALGALAQPGWMSGLRNSQEELEELSGAALSFGYYRWQGFPCDEEAWSRVHAEEPRPRSRCRSIQCQCPTVAEPHRGFSSKQKRWVVLNLRATGLAVLEVLQSSMTRSAREKPVDFLGHEARKTLVAIYPYDQALFLTWREMLDMESEPNVKVEPRSPRQELTDRRKRSAEQRKDYAVMATYNDQLHQWQEFSAERRGRTGRKSRVALSEAPAALNYDPQSPPSNVGQLSIRQRLGPMPTFSGTTFEGGSFVDPADEEVEETLRDKDEPDGKPPPRHGRVVRQQRRERSADAPKDGVVAAALERRNRRTLKRFFEAITTERTALHPHSFLGPMMCHQCGKKNHGDDICWVTMWKQGGAMPRNRTMPCLYCRSRQHVVDACCYLHNRCVRCGLLGHVRAECRDQAQEVWKQLFLECADFGVLTGRNPYGPIRGRFGLGREPREEEGRVLA